MVLRIHAKFAMIEDLSLEDLEVDIKMGLGKYRYTVLS